MAKNNYITLFCFFVIGIIAVSCNSKKNSISVDSSKVTQELLDRDIQFSDYCMKNGINEAFINYIADEGVLLRPNHHPLVGKDSVIKLYSKNKSKNYNMHWKPSYAYVASSGELGYTYGIYELNGTSPDGTAVAENGTYVSIWKKDSSGIWKLALDSGNEGLGSGK